MLRLFGIVTLVVAADAASAQTSELYITQYNSRDAVVVQDGSVVRSWSTQFVGETALAVTGESIRTGGNYWDGNGGDGAEYDLLGNPLGPVYTMPEGGNWFDGATDGNSFNYAVQHNGDYNLWRFDREWSNAEVLFHVGFATSGITYDTSNDTFWVVSSLARLVRNIDMDGNVLSSFNATHGGSKYGIAMDPADRTLWVGGFNSNTIYQYGTDGALFSTVSVPGIDNAYGMEFAIIPSPAPLAALAGGMLVRQRRRR